MFVEERSLVIYSVIECCTINPINGGSATNDSVLKFYAVYIDMFSRTNKYNKMLLICFRELSRAFDVLPILSCHVETIVLLTRS